MSDDYDPSYHRDLFAWHCETFYDLEARLRPSELFYLHTCFSLATDYVEVSPSGYAHFSYYTYSHRVAGDRVNASRFAYGSIKNPVSALDAAQDVLRWREITIDPELLALDTVHFYGLGWDLEAGDFKIYLRCDDVNALPAERNLLPEDLRQNPIRAEGLVSFTYRDDRLREEKLYVYPTGQIDDDSVRGEAKMATSARGVVSQLDVIDNAVWKERVNDVGRRIIEAYEEIGEHLDTIAFQDRDHFTLYFP